MELVKFFIFDLQKCQFYVVPLNKTKSSYVRNVQLQHGLQREIVSFPSLGEIQNRSIVEKIPESDRKLSCNHRNRCIIVTMTIYLTLNVALSSFI